MERLGAGQPFQDLYALDHANSYSGPKPDNRLYLLLGYQALTLCFNPTFQFEGLPRGPENNLDLETFARGWEEALSSRAKPWL